MKHFVSYFIILGVIITAHVGEVTTVTKAGVFNNGYSMTYAGMVSSAVFSVIKYGHRSMTNLYYPVSVKRIDIGDGCTVEIVDVRPDALVVEVD
jgi:hypothetical protein